MRRRFPQSQIDFVTKREYGELVKYNQNINYTYEFDAATGLGGLRDLKRQLRRERYDLVIDLHNSLRSRYLRNVGTQPPAVVNKRLVARTALVRMKWHWYRDSVSVAERYLEPVRRYGVADDGNGLELPIPDSVQHEVSGKLSRLRLDRFERVVGICPGARHETKRWPAERFVDLGVQLARGCDAGVLLFGGTEDAERCETIRAAIAGAVGDERATSYAGSLSLLGTAFAMTPCDVIITNDSGLMHLAAAMKKPVVALFGSTVREFGFFPFRTENVVLEKSGLTCRPCTHVGLPACPKGHFNCMRGIEVEDVAKASSELLQRKSA